MAERLYRICTGVSIIVVQFEHRVLSFFCLLHIRFWMHDFVSPDLFFSPLGAGGAGALPRRMRPVYSRVRCLPHPRVGFPPQRGPSTCLGRLPSTHSCTAEKANTPPSLHRTLWEISTRPLSIACQALAALESRSATVASIFSPPARIPSSPTRPTRSNSIKRRSCVRRNRQTNP